MEIIKKAIVVSLLVMVLTSCSIFVPGATATPISTDTLVPTSVEALEPTSTQPATPVPQYTKTAKPSIIVDTQDGKLFINHKYGFSILLPSDSDSVIPNRTDLSEMLITELPTIRLDDGGDIVPLLQGWVEEQTDECHPQKISETDVPVKAEHMSLGGNSYTKMYTPDRDQDDRQHIEYMTYDTDFCVHFGIDLATYYFDRPVDAHPPRDMLPYIQDELDRIISTFQWIKP